MPVSDISFHLTPYVYLDLICEICGLCEMPGTQHTFKHPHSSGVIIYASRGPQRGSDDGGGGDEIVGEGVVEVALQLEDVLDLVEFFFVSG